MAVNILEVLLISEIAALVIGVLLYVKKNGKIQKIESKTDELKKILPKLMLCNRSKNIDDIIEVARQNVVVSQFVIEEIHYEGEHV